MSCFVTFVAGETQCCTLTLIYMYYHPLHLETSVNKLIFRDFFENLYFGSTNFRQSRTYMTHSCYWFITKKTISRQFAQCFSLHENGENKLIYNTLNFVFRRGSCSYPRPSRSTRKIDCWWPRNTRYGIMNIYLNTWGTTRKPFTPQTPIQMTKRRSMTQAHHV